MRNLILFVLLLNGSLLIGQTHQFTGFWTKINTTYVFEFDLILETDGAGKVSGHFQWTVIKYDEHNNQSKEYYGDKIGTTGREYVRGTYNKSTGELNLKGYRKDDPDMIIGIDTYYLKVDKNGDLSGDTNANGSWLGRIKGRTSEINLM